MKKLGTWITIVGLLIVVLDVLRVFGKGPLALTLLIAGLLLGLIGVAILAFALTSEGRPKKS